MFFLYYPKGLRDGNFQTPTEIQHDSLMSALTGNDILGAAKTGSGKTLAFLIPVCTFWLPVLVLVYCKN